MTDYVEAACRNLEQQMNNGDHLESRHWLKLYIAGNKKDFKRIYTSLPDFSYWEDAVKSALVFLVDLASAIASTFIWITAPVLVPLHTYLEVQEKRSAYEQYLEDVREKGDATE